MAVEQNDVAFYHAKARACDERAQAEHCLAQHRETYLRAARRWREMARQAALDEALASVVTSELRLNLLSAR